MNDEQRARIAEIEATLAKGGVCYMECIGHHEDTNEYEWSQGPDAEPDIRCLLALIRELDAELAKARRETVEECCKIICVFCKYQHEGETFTLENKYWTHHLFTQRAEICRATDIRARFADLLAGEGGGE